MAVLQTRIFIKFTTVFSCKQSDAIAQLSEKLLISDFIGSALSHQLQACNAIFRLRDLFNVLSV